MALSEGTHTHTHTVHPCRFGKIEEVHILPQKHPSQGIAAFVDFANIHDAMSACRERHKWEGRELRINYKFTDSRPSPDPPSPPTKETKKGKRQRLVLLPRVQVCCPPVFVSLAIPLDSRDTGGKPSHFEVLQNCPSDRCF